MSITRKSKALVLAAAVTLYAATPVTWANGNPNKEYGPHDYQLLLIGMNDTDGKLGNGGEDNGKRIFVKLSGRTKIMLTEGDFDVIDADGTDGEASFMLPNPDENHDGTTEYRVYARALGNPTAWASIVACADDGTTTYCGTGTVLQRDGGNGNKPRWQNVSRSLLYVEFDYDGDGKLELIPLFDDELQGYFWDYDNNGLRVAQLRFYYVPQDVCSEAGGTVVEGYCQLP
jgi:hypothetical protein